MDLNPQSLNSRVSDIRASVRGLGLEGLGGLGLKSLGGIESSPWSQILPSRIRDPISGPERFFS